jgi:hypothetical protein
MDINTADVKANCSDLKVLGKGDFKLLQWWLALGEQARNRLLNSTYSFAHAWPFRRSG